MAAVVFTVDDEAGMGRKRLGNAEVLAAAARQPGRADPVRAASTRTRASSPSARRAS